MKVFVVYDPLYEKVIAVFKTEDSADRYCDKRNKEEDRYKDYTYPYSYDEFEVQE